jgi:hypothetical protein
MSEAMTAPATPRLVLGQWKRTYQRMFALGFLIAAGLHLMLTFSFRVATTERAHEATVQAEGEGYDLVQPPVRFELRAPRLAKSFSVSKTPSYAQTFTPREIKFTPTEVTRVEQTTTTTTARASARGNRTEGSIFYGALTGGAGAAEASWGIPGGAVAFGRSLSAGGRLGWGEGQTGGVDFQPDIADDIVNLRGGGTGLQTMRDDLVDYTNFSDRFEGFVIQDRSNKKKISGHLNFYQLRWRATKSEPNGEDGWNVYPRALPALMAYAMDSTDIKITLAGNVRLDDQALFSIPIIFMMGQTAAVQYTPQEAKNLGKWLRAGGFLFIDDGFANIPGAFNKSARALLKDALGYDAEFERLQSKHQLYHAWEDFDGPPPGLDNANVPLTSVGGSAVPTRFNERYPYLEGIFLNGRLAVLFSSKGYTHAWSEWRFVSSANGGPLDNTRQLHFGINIVVYASTAKGGLMDQIRAKVASEYQRK